MSSYETNLKSNNNALHGKLHFSINNYKNPSFIQSIEHLMKIVAYTTALRTLHIATFSHTFLEQSIKIMLPFQVFSTASGPVKNHPHLVVFFFFFYCEKYVLRTLQLFAAIANA